VNAASSEHGEKIIDAVRDIDGIEVVNVSDLTFLMHLGGKIEVVSKMPLKTRADLSMAYTPGVARVCEAIRDDPEKVFTLTIKKNTVAVVTDLANCWQEDGGDESCCEWSRRCWCRMFKDHHGSGREERNRL